MEHALDELLQPYVRDLQKQDDVQQSPTDCATEYQRAKPTSPQLDGYRTDGRAWHRSPHSIAEVRTDGYVCSQVEEILGQYRVAAKQQWAMLERRMTDSAGRPRSRSAVENLGFERAYSCSAAVLNVLMISIHGSNSAFAVDDIDLGLSSLEEHSEISRYHTLGCSARVLLAMLKSYGWRQMHRPGISHRGFSGFVKRREPGAQAYVLNNTVHWLVLVQLMYCLEASSWLWVLHDPDDKDAWWFYIGTDDQLDAFIEKFVADGDNHKPPRQNWVIPLAFSDPS